MYQVQLQWSGQLFGHMLPKTPFNSTHLIAFVALNSMTKEVELTSKKIVKTVLWQYWFSCLSYFFNAPKEDVLEMVLQERIKCAEDMKKKHDKYLNCHGYWAAIDETAFFLLSG